MAMSGSGKNPAAGSWDINPVFDVTKFQVSPGPADSTCFGILSRGCHLQHCLEAGLVP